MKDCKMYGKDEPKMNPMIVEYTEDKKTSEFYPTPKSLVGKMVEKIDWKKVDTILEPSAGKGDILLGISDTINAYDYKKPDIDCIEIDGNLRSILKYQFSEERTNNLRKQISDISGSEHLEQDWDTKRYKYYNSKECKYCYLPDDKQRKVEEIYDTLHRAECIRENIHIVHDDFLSYEPFKEYDLIIMNPPFSEGDKHLLKALDIQKNGGSIICLLNAETIRNPYTNTRKTLVGLLNKYNAEITYIKNGFAQAERQTDVEIALIKVDVPKNDNEMSIFEKLAKAREYTEPSPNEITALEVTDFVKAIVNRYRLEAESGIELIRTYNRMLPYLNRSEDEKNSLYDGKLIELTDGRKNKVTVNSYLQDVRLKYWKALLDNPRFVGKLTSKLQSEYRSKILTFYDYDFSEFNINALLCEINSQIKSGIEAEIEVMYDRLTEEHSYYPECSKNKHYYDGWTTNKAWKIDKKSIISCYGTFDDWDGSPRTYKAYSTLSDIERVLNFFDGNMTAEIDLKRTIEENFSLGVTKNIHCKFFDVTFYKKGTVHIVYTCPELIERYNIYIGRGKNWLPPSYGKKKYSDMTEEEKAVIDSFQGETAYKKVMERADYYLAPLTVQKNLALMMN